MQSNCKNNKPSKTSEVLLQNTTNCEAVLYASTLMHCLCVAWPFGGRTGAEGLLVSSTQY